MSSSLVVVAAGLVVPTFLLVWCMATRVKLGACGAQTYSESCTVQGRRLGPHSRLYLAPGPQPHVHPKNLAAPALTRLSALANESAMTRPHLLPHSYRLAAQDYLAAGNSRWYGGVQESLGLCVALAGLDGDGPGGPDGAGGPGASGGSMAGGVGAGALGALGALGIGGGSDPHKYFTRAHEHFSRLPVAPPGTAAGAGGGGRPGTAGGAPGGPGASPTAASVGPCGPRGLATRTALLAGAYLSAVGRHAVAAGALMRAHFEVGKRPACLGAGCVCGCMLLCFRARV